MRDLQEKKNDRAVYFGGKLFSDAVSTARVCLYGVTFNKKLVGNETYQMGDFYEVCTE